MIEIQDKKNCSGCEACLNICPVNCITMQVDDEGFRYPKVDKTKCINCHQCEKVCPIINKMQSDNKGYIIYGAINKNKKILKKSTSGGVFYELAKKMIEDKNGVVFGVRYDEKENALFDYAEDLTKLEQFLGSKYVQAKINESYRLARQFLNEGRYVLFSGTPCQIAGLKSYLKKDYEKLYTCDFVCEGVTNDKLLNSFKEYYENKYKTKIKDIKFRNKKFGWQYFGFLITFENNKKLYIPRNSVNYLKIFYGLLYNRPSCYACNFRELKSSSDFKLADFWEVRNSKHCNYDFYGVSHFLVNNKKAEDFFESIKEKFILDKSDIMEIKKLNGTFNSQEFDMEKRNEFSSQIQNKNSSEIFQEMDKYVKHNNFEKIKLYLVKIKYTFLKRK